MILRRLSRAVREQNWFAVALEFVLVISGVVIGFQVTAWNEGRQDRVDEASFLIELHEDVVLAESLSARLRERRLDRLTHIRSAVETIFGRTDRDELTDPECSAVSSMHYFNINVPDLTAFAELADAGRIDILRDEPLRRALVGYRQSRTALRDYIILQNDVSHDLPFLFPELISVDAFYDDEIRATPVCDLAAMRENRLFLNGVTQNADAYDAYIRDGLHPWSDQLDRVHEQADALLGITHQGPIQ